VETPAPDAIISRVRLGDHEAFGALVEQFLPMVHAVVHAQLGTWGDVDDIAQDVFLKAYLSLDTLREPKKFPAWLAAIARNMAVNSRRSLRRAERNAAALHALPEQNQIEDPAAMELHEMVKRAVCDLSETNREVLLLYYFSQKDLREIASALDITHANAKKRLQRARAELEEHMANTLDDVLEPYRPTNRQVGMVIGAIAAVKPQWVTAGTPAAVGVASTVWGTYLMSKKAIAAMVAAISLVGAGISATYVVGRTPGYRDRDSVGIQASSQSSNQSDLSRDSDSSSPIRESAEQVDVSGQIVSVPGTEASHVAKSGPSPTERVDAKRVVNTGVTAQSQRSAMAGGNAQRTGFHNVHGPLTQPELLWEIPLGKGERLPGTAASIDSTGRIFGTHGALGEDVFAAYTPEGKLVWEFGPVKRGPGRAAPTVLPNGKVLQPFDDGTVKSFDPASGVVVWSLDVLIRAGHNPLVDSQSNVYFPAQAESNLLKIDGNTGALIWPDRVDFKGVDSERGLSVALSNDEQRLYLTNFIAPQTKGYLSAVDATDGSVVWTFAPEDSQQFLRKNWATPAVAGDGTIFVQDAWTGQLYALSDNGAAASLRWQYNPIDTGVVQRYEDVTEDVFVNTYRIAVRDAPRSIATDGESVYMSVYGSPASVHAVSVDGEARWRTALLDDAIVGSPVVTPDAVYVLAAGDERVPGSSSLFCLDRSSGSVLWQMPVARPYGDTGESIALGTDGTIYLASSSHEETGAVMRAWR